MHTRTHAWITYMLAYLLAAVIENTLCYLTMIQSSLHQKGGKSCSSWKSFKHSAQVAYTQHGFCVHVRLVRVNMRQ
jgi:hypothetical protein